MQLPERTVLLGFGPGGETAVVGAESICELIEVASGRLIMRLADANEHRLVGHSRDGRVWLFQRHDGAAPRFSKADLIERTTGPLTDVPLEAAKAEHEGPPSPNSLSPDGRYCVLQSGKPSNSVVVWDLNNNRIVALANDIRSPVVFAPDGQFVCGRAVEQSNLLRVMDLRNGLVQTTLEGPEYGILGGFGQVIELHVSPDGSSIAADFLPTRAITSPARDRWVWALPSGQLQWQAPVIPRGFGAHVLVTPDHRIENPLAGTFPVSPTPGPTGLPQRWFPEFASSPDGRVVLAPVEESNAGVLEQWAKQLGLRLTSGRSGYKIVGHLFDSATERHLGTIPADLSDYLPSGANLLTIQFMWTSDGQKLGVTNREDKTRTWQIWEIPPRKSLTWFCAGAALLALPTALVARWRIHRLGAL